LPKDSALTHAAGPLLEYRAFKRVPTPRSLTWLVLAICTLTCLWLLAIALAGAIQAHLWTNYVARLPYDPTEQSLLKILYPLIPWGWLFPPTMALLLIAWMFTTLKRTPNCRFRPRDAILAWILRQHLFIRPFEIMRDLRIASGVTGKFPWAGCWWTFWIAANIVNLTAFCALNGYRGEPAQYAIDSGQWDVIRVPLYLVSALTLMVTIYKIDRAQAHRDPQPNP